MKNKIENQITAENWKKIRKLENEKNKIKQEKIANELIEEIRIENFKPYKGVDNDGNIFICLNQRYELYTIQNFNLTGKHDVEISSEGVYVKDESILI